MKKGDLQVIDAEPLGDGIISLLEDALERARRNELSSVALATVNRDGTVGSVWSEAPNTSLLIGSIARLQFSVTRAVEE